MNTIEDAFVLFSFVFPLFLWPLFIEVCVMDTKSRTAGNGIKNGPRRLLWKEKTEGKRCCKKLFGERCLNNFFLVRSLCYLLKCLISCLLGKTHIYKQNYVLCFNLSFTRLTVCGYTLYIICFFIIFNISTMVYFAFKFFETPFVPSLEYT